MNFEKAMENTCKILGYDSHIKIIKKKSEAYTYAEKIATRFELPIAVKNSYMYLDGVDFCFYQNGNDVNFAISGNIRANDKLKIEKAISKALEICSVCEWQMQFGDEKEQLKGEKI